ncbi:hypothetical protein C5167_048836 [Papaver somniferum]|uniref:Uncharacterized protein n=1 Tax=Papaver somniferum TaxID=3469 RepID=A0A4Y7KMG0_PAPSO|nr:hypothetical protein C5167_048836 [Papaver somniferum]
MKTSLIWSLNSKTIRADSSSEDNVGRTVAIIVGVLAGVAVIIVLLSFLRKALGMPPPVHDRSYSSKPLDAHTQVQTKFTCILVCTSQTIENSMTVQKHYIRFQVKSLSDTIVVDMIPDMITVPS